MRTFPQFLADLDLPDGRNAGTMSVFLAYEDLSAALWAAETLRGLRGRGSRRSEPHLLSPWSFTTLENPRCVAHSTELAIRADLIVIAISSELGLLPGFLERWLKRCLVRQPGVNTAVAALFGRSDAPDQAGSPRLKAVQGLAEKAGCAFFAPWAKEGES